MFGFLEDKNRETRAGALAALVDLAEGDEDLLERVLPLVEAAATSGTPSTKTRAAALLRRLTG